MPNLLSLKNAIYSKSYLQIIERLTNLPPNTLTNTTIDCAINCHTKGCHLLCHDDVIGTRKISFIIYLTEAGWSRDDGGCLELYDAVQEEDDDGDDDNNDEKKQPASSTGTSQRHVPTALPTKTILPNFNTMAYFVVKPGVSFHSVQEVFNVDKPRLSIQGWYHAKEQPDDIENATLQRLKSSGIGEDTEGEFEPLPPVVEKEKEASSEAISTSTAPLEAESSSTHNLSEGDINFLSQYMNKAYLSTESMNEIQKRFENESSVQLRHFLLDEWNTKITTTMNDEDTRDKLGNDRPALDYQVGITNKWRAVGPAHKQRFLQYDDDESKEYTTATNNSNTGEYLYHIRHTLFKSTAFGKWLGYITSLDYPLGQRGRVRRFRPGLDYTVAHYGVLTTHSVLDATLCFCAGNGEQCTFDEETNELIGSDDDAIWESGDVGGFECYIAADEGGGEDDDNGRDAEYDDEDDTRLLSVSASNNTLSLVYRDPGTMRFVKYVGR